MKCALVDRQIVEASPESPARADCPACGEAVELRRTQSGCWHWRHAVGQGASCSRRSKPVTRPRQQENQPGDPYHWLAMDCATQAVRQARRGVVPAILSVAFSDLVHHALGVVDVTPEDVLARLPSYRATLVLVTDDEPLVLELVRGMPAPILDLRQQHNGHQDALQALPWYVALPDPQPTYIRLVERVLRLVPWAYILHKNLQPDLVSPDAGIAVTGGEGKLLYIRWQ